jgi:hypothetical protein
MHMSSAEGSLQTGAQAPGLATATNGLATDRSLAGQVAPTTKGGFRDDDAPLVDVPHGVIGVVHFGNRPGPRLHANRHATGTQQTTRAWARPCHRPTAPRAFCCLRRAADTCTTHNPQPAPSPPTSVGRCHRHPPRVQLVVPVPNVSHGARGVVGRGPEVQAAEQAHVVCVVR